MTPTPRPARCATALLELTGANVAVVVTDTAGRAWREGQTDIAIGAAGLRRRSTTTPGASDPYGNGWP